MSKKISTWKGQGVDLLAQARGGSMPLLTKKELKRVTTKKERQAMKEAKKQANLKTRTEREAEVQDTKSQLAKWNLDEKFDAIRTLFAELDLFVETGQSVAGRIQFLECPPQPMGRVIVYSFVNRRGNKGTCDLLVRDGQEYFASEKRRRNQNVPSTPLPSSLGGTSSISEPSSTGAIGSLSQLTSSTSSSSSGSTFEQELMSVLATSSGNTIDGNKEMSDEPPIKVENENVIEVLQ